MPDTMGRKKQLIAISKESFMTLLFCVTVDFYIIMWYNTYDFADRLIGEGLLWQIA